MFVYNHMKKKKSKDKRGTKILKNINIFEWFYVIEASFLFIYYFFIETEVKEKVKEEKIRIRFNKAKI